MSDAIKKNERFGPGTVLVGTGEQPGNTAELPYVSLIPGNPHYVGEASGTPGTEFQSKNEARKFGRQVADLNPPLDRSKLFRP